MLKMASARGFIRSSYTLGIILRDALPVQASRFMNLAASTGYLPALQELLSAREMKERYWEPKAEDLRQYLDPKCLNRLLLRDYVDSAELRGLNTSHCWNPLCGKWAYKATNATAAVRMRRPYAPLQGGGVYEAVEGGNDPIIDIHLPSANGGRHRHRPVAIVGDRRTSFINSTAADGSRSPISTTSSESGSAPPSPTKPCQHGLAYMEGDTKVDRVSRMKMCSRCCRAKYCSKLCQVYDWRSSQHKMECQFL